MAIINSGELGPYADLIRNTNVPLNTQFSASDVAKVWDSIANSNKIQKSFSGASLPWNKLAPEDQAAISNLLTSNPDILFQDVAGQTLIRGGAYNVSSSGDTNTVEATSIPQQAGTYFANYYSPTQSELLYRITPQIAAKYGINQQTVDANRSAQDKYASKVDSAEWEGMDKEALLMALTVISAGAAGGAFSGAAAGEGAAAGGSAWGSLDDIAAGSGTAASTGGSTALTGTMAGGESFVGPATGSLAPSTEIATVSAAPGVSSAGITTSGLAYYDAGAGMWIDEATGQGIASGASVPAGYTAEAGQIANAAADVAPSVSADSWMQQLSNYGSQASDWLQQGNNAQNVANALKTFTQSPTASNGGSGFTGGVGDSFGDYGSGSSGSSGAVNSTNGQSQLLEMPVSATYQDQQSPQQAPSPLGMIDMSSANNTFQQAGSTWNQQLANALRNRNAY